MLARTWFCAVMLTVVVLSACSAAGPVVVPPEAAEAVEAARESLARDFGIDLSQADLFQVERVEWPDSCLGLGQPNETCALVVTPGWRVRLRMDDREIEVRTDDTGEQVRISGLEDVPPIAVLEAQRQLAERLDVQVQRVEILSAQRVEWADACLELGGSEEVCAQVITPGWRVIFEVDGQRVEVRTDESGEQVRVVP